jgi:hypothetical protein
MHGHRQRWWQVKILILIDWLIDRLCRWGETSQNHGNQQAYFSPLSWYVSVECHGVDDAGWGKFLTHPPELSGSPTSRVIWEKVWGMDEGVRILHISIWDTQQIFNKPYNLTTWVLQLYFPSEGLLLPLKIHRLSRVSTLDPWQAH